MIDKLFTWWNGATLGALFDIKRRSAFIGEDTYGNKYYEDRKSSMGNKGYKRRYVVYQGLAEPSKVPPEWHGWLHHTLAEPPTEAPLPRKSFELDHKPNMTGTVYATRPKGALSEKGERQDTYADYEAWTPDA
ncbi:MAG: NADH:ubiquinone oxidoreductase subunit NDUFA12 [Pseudomonadota bacterium]